MGSHLSHHKAQLFGAKEMIPRLQAQTANQHWFCWSVHEYFSHYYLWWRIPRLSAERKELAQLLELKKYTTGLGGFKLDETFMKSGFY